MHHLSIDHLIVGIVMLVTLVIGFWSGRGIRDIREYATANKMLGTWALVLTWLATDIAGETVLDTINSIRTVGILKLIAAGGVVIAILAQAFFFAPKFAHFKDCITIGDVIGKLYKGPSQIIAGILNFFTALCITGMEITVIGLLCETLLGIDYRWGVGIGGGMLVLYTVHGGIKSVAFTDVFQFLVLFVVLPVITVKALDSAGGIGNVFSQLPSDQFRIFNHPKGPYYLALFLSLSIFQFSVIDPALIQRMLMGRTEKQLRHQFFIMAAFKFALIPTYLLLGLASLVLYPEATDSTILPHIIRDILPAGIKGLAIAGLFAITMATFDSFLHAAGLTLVHDVMRPLFSKKITPNELSWTRWMTLLAGLVTIAVGMVRADDLYEFVLISYKFTGPLLAFPLFAGVLGLKPDKQAFYIAAGVTIMVLLLADFLLPADYAYLSPLISVITNGVVFLGIHFVHNRGFVIVNHEKKHAHLWQPTRKSFLAKLQALLPSPQNIVSYSQGQVEKYGAPYILLGVFVIVNYMLPYFMWGHSSVQSHDLMLYLRFIGAMACGLLVVKEKWPKSLLRYLPTFWHLTLLYCLPFTSTVMFLLTQGSTEWLINVTMTIMFLVVLVDWKSFLILTGLGIALGFLFYTQVVGPIHVPLSFSTGYLLVYQGIFATMIGLLFARRRQIRTEQRQKILQSQEQATQAQLLRSATLQANTLKAIEETSANRLLQIIKTLKDLPTQGKNEKQLQTAISSLVPMAFQLQSIHARAKDYLRLEIKPLVIDEWLRKLRTQLYDQGMANNVQFIRKTQHTELRGDDTQLTQLLHTSIRLLRQEEGLDEELSFLVGLEDTMLHYPLPTIGSDYVKQVQALRIVVTTEDNLPPLEGSYQADLSTPASAFLGDHTTYDLSVQECKCIVKAHYGYTEIAKNTLLYVIPVDLHEVRSKDMDNPYMALGSTPVRANDQYKDARLDAQAQEKAFLAAVQSRSKANIGLIQIALELIKWYHGPVNRHSGEPFYLHPLTVAQIVLDYNTDEETILGALLHDTVEDTSMLLQNIETAFGYETASVVDTVTHLESMQNSIFKIRLSAIENLQLLERTGNKRGLYVKLADRVHNIKTISGHPMLSKRVSIAQETLDFFVPLANRLELGKVADKLKSICEQVLRNKN